MVGRQFVPFVGAGRELGDFGDLPLQPFPLALQRILCRARMLERGKRLAPALPGGVERIRAYAGIGVEQAAHGFGARKALPGVLAMDVEQAVAKLAQLRGGGRAAVDPATAASLQVDGAAQQQGVAGFEAAFVEPCVQVRIGVELGAHIEPFGAFAHSAGVGAVAQRQLQRVDQDGFARAGFTGQHRETSGQVEFE